jgi:hypothetical protein
LPNSAITANLGLVRLFDPMAYKPRNQTVRARAKKLTRGKQRVAANGLTNQNEQYQQQMMIHAEI